jgi:hypothetical protein
MDFGDLIPVVSILAALGFAWLGLRNRQLKVEARRLEVEAEANAAEKHRLEQRVAVLERIATDRGVQTADQIEALRDRV